MTTQTVSSETVTQIEEYNRMINAESSVESISDSPKKRIVIHIKTGDDSIPLSDVLSALEKYAKELNENSYRYFNPKERWCALQLFQTLSKITNPRSKFFPEIPKFQKQPLSRHYQAVSPKTFEELQLDQDDKLGNWTAGGKIVAYYLKQSAISLLAES